MEFMEYDSKIFPSFRWIIWKYFTASKALKGLNLKLYFIRVNRKWIFPIFYKKNHFYTNSYHQNRDKTVAKEQKKKGGGNRSLIEFVSKRSQLMARCGWDYFIEINKSQIKQVVSIYF